MAKKKELVADRDLPSNPFNDLFHAALPERKTRFQEEEEPELDEESKRLEQKKRARYEALKEKYSDSEY